MISKGKFSEEPFEKLDSITEADIAGYYLGIKSIPCLINSPLRIDNSPSFSIFSTNGINVNYKDFSTGECGRIWTILAKIWNCSYKEVQKRVYNDLHKINCKTLNNSLGITNKKVKVISHLNIQCKVREWRDYDLKYWESYGISLKWLKYANVFPISHKIIVKDGISHVFASDKYAYAYAEFKDGKTTLKIYQPFNKNGYKWSNSHDRSVLSLWTKIPEKGDRICICSSMKDALCLWANTGIPSVAVQGEGYILSKTAINNLNARFKNVYILFDNDPPGLKDGKKLAKITGFKNIVLPKSEGGKDISDIYKIYNNKDKFKNFILKLFNND